MVDITQLYYSGLIVCVVVPLQLMTNAAPAMLSACLNMACNGFRMFCLTFCCSAEDVRSYKFAAFNAREELQPTQDQLRAAENLVDALDLAQGLVPSCC